MHLLTVELTTSWLKAFFINFRNSFNSLTFVATGFSIKILEFNLLNIVAYLIWEGAGLQIKVILGLNFFASSKFLK